MGPSHSDSVTLEWYCGGPTPYPKFPNPRSAASPYTALKAIPQSRNLRRVFRLARIEPTGPIGFSTDAIMALATGNQQQEGKSWHKQSWDEENEACASARGLLLHLQLYPRSPAHSIEA